MVSKLLKEFLKKLLAMLTVCLWVCVSKAIQEETASGNQTDGSAEAESYATDAFKYTVAVQSCDARPTTVH